jgi:hypothetical protein
MTDIADRQPHIVINMSDKVHVINIADLRRLAIGYDWLGDDKEIIMVLSKAIIDLTER